MHLDDVSFLPFDTNTLMKICVRLRTTSPSYSLTFKSFPFYLTGLFGEGPAERRERLRKLLAELGESAIQKKKEEKRIELKKKEQVKF